MFIFDAIHGEIPICESAKKIIDTSEFQRLRSIAQGGGIYSVWTGSSHRRFEHSIGVYHLSRRLMDLLLIKHKNSINMTEYSLISIGALIHDLGHCISSHLFDDWLKEMGIDSVHENRSISVFKFMNEKYNLGYNIYDISFIENVINPNYDDMDSIGEKRYLYQIVSSENGVDVDRMDYILRDSTNSGMKYSFELDTILNNTFIQDNNIVFSDKAKCSIDSFFHTRYSLYKQVCNNSSVIAVEHHMKEVLTIIDPVLKITNSIINEDWDKFCKFTDNIFSVIDFIDDSRLDKAKEIMNNIKTRNILKLVGGIISDKELNIVSQNENVIVIKTKIKYNSYELPKYISNNRMKINHNDEKRPDEYILKIMCKDPNNRYAISLLDKFE
jgi:HD superfamily phosphohydrolase